MAKCEGFDEAAAHWVLVQYDKLYEKGNNNLKKVNPLNLLKFLFFFPDIITDDWSIRQKSENNYFYVWKCIFFFLIH